MAEKDIVETAVAAGVFSTLAAALGAADLVTTLKGAGPFTVFAPTDEAFKKLPAGAVEALLKNKALLTRVLTYHVVSGNVTAAQAMKLTEAKTVEGSPVAIRLENGSVFIGKNSKVTSADVHAKNGVIHVVDNVILPPNFSL